MEKQESNKKIDSKAFYEEADVINLETCINALRTFYIDLVADGKPNILIYGTFYAHQRTKEKEALAQYFRSVCDSILRVYDRVYKERTPF